MGRHFYFLMSFQSVFRAIFTARNEKADLGFSVLKSAFRSLSSFMFFRYVSAIRGTAAMLRQMICPVFRDRADLL